MHVKTFRVIGETINRNNEAIKTLGSKIDDQINGFIAANPNVELKDVILNTSLGGSTEHAVVTIMYEGELGSPTGEAAAPPKSEAPVADLPPIE